MNEFIERFRDRFELMEKERLKLSHDRKAYLFLILLIGFLGLCSLVSGLVGQSRLVIGVGVLFLISVEIVRRLRSGLGQIYQLKFRELITRDWFHSKFQTAYLVPAPARDQVPLEILRGLREACIRVTTQTPSRTVIDERLFFDADSQTQWTFILKETRLYSRATTRALVWYRAHQVQDNRVAYVWPPAPGAVSRAPDVKFFADGKAVPAPEPLRTKLVELFDLLRVRSKEKSSRVAISPSGLWAGVKLVHQPFRAPVNESCLDPAAYASWIDDARLFVDRDIPRLMANL